MGRQDKTRQTRLHRKSHPSPLLLARSETENCLLYGTLCTTVRRRGTDEGTFTYRRPASFLPLSSSSYSCPVLLPSICTWSCAVLSTFTTATLPLDRPSSPVLLFSPYPESHLCHTSRSEVEIQGSG
ncbi:hypothetical protein VTL71DRAFT_8300 [Oculimacula yallundae]|uniref:Uncharacterized protein n=1 Tax=Oculimacula yallundae TaxID=86028 RepID=A0ABR4CY80_9HELO